jgi:hypothetical protein
MIPGVTPSCGARRHPLALRQRGLLIDLEASEEAGWRWWIWAAHNLARIRAALAG